MLTTLPDEFVAACAGVGDLSDATTTDRRNLRRRLDKMDLSLSHPGQHPGFPALDGPGIGDGDSPINELLFRLASSLRRSWRASQSKSAALRTFLRDPYVREVSWLVFVIAIGLGILFVPMWWLDGVDDGVRRLGTITGLVVFLTTALQRGPRVKAYEMLGAAAA